MGRYVLLQIASGEPYESMLHLSKEHHHAYCQKFKWEYSPRIQAVPTGPWLDRSMGELFMIQALGEYAEGDVLCFMNVDALILKKTARDLRECLRDGDDLAMAGKPGSSNSGFTLVRVSQKLKDFYAAVLKKGPAENNNDISPAIARALQENPQIACNYLSSAWQWGSGQGIEMDCPEEKAIIRAWHGGSRYLALNEMKIAMVGIAEGVL